MFSSVDFQMLLARRYLWIRPLLLTASDHDLYMTQTCPVHCHVFVLAFSIMFIASIT